MNKYTLPRFCRLCHQQLREDEYDKCDKCRKFPLRSVVNSYGSEDEKMRQELYETDHDCRRPDSCATCGRIYEATHDELIKMIATVRSTHEL